MNRHKTNAFTLVELLVVIAIIGILVAMLLPAIQASRESARRASCTNQLRQLIIAVHNYEMAHEHFPPGTLNATGPIRNVPSGHHISWIAHILPYIDEHAVFSNLDLSLSAYHQRNDLARQVTITRLICPSIPAVGWPYSTYAGCHHDVEAPIDADNRGVFFLNSRLTRDDLKDGAAYTLFLGEKLVDDFDLGWLSGTPSTLRNTGSPLNAQNRAAMIGAGVPWLHDHAPDDSQWSWDQKTDADADAGEQAAAPARPELTPDAEGRLPHSRLGGDPANPLAVGGFASSHLSGVNFAMGDGSVRFITDNVSAGLMGRLANRADGQIVNANEW